MTDDQINEWTKEDLLNSPLLSDEEIEELRQNKRHLTAQATQKLRRMKSQKQAKIIREVVRQALYSTPMTQECEVPITVAAFRSLIEQCGYDNYHVDGDHGLMVVNVRDILGIIEILEEMK